MNVNSLIKTALASLNLPIEADKYTGAVTEYIVFNYVSESPGVYADDADIEDETTVRINYYVKGNPHAKKETIRQLMRNAGFEISDTLIMYEEDTNYNHVIIECWIDGTIDDT